MTYKIKAYADGSFAQEIECDPTDVGALVNSVIRDELNYSERELKIVIRKSPKSINNQ